MVKVMSVVLKLYQAIPIRYSLGEMIAHKDKCAQCHGNKISEETKILEVVILPGCSNGKKIKFRGENDQLVSQAYFTLLFK